MFKKLKEYFFGRSVSEVLRVVAQSKYYNRTDDAMCLSLNEARRRGLVTDREARKAKREIFEYIRPSIFLANALHRNRLPRYFETRKAIYLDWDNRPKLR